MFTDNSTMDLRLVICVAVLAFASVEAMRLPEMGRRCRIRCPFGFEPDFACRCRQGSFQDMSPCNMRNCPWNTQCEVQGGRAVCVPEGIAFPTEPLLPNEPLPFDPIVSLDACMHPKEAGLCRAYKPRYYYNIASRRCERFIYGGCGGNENNFRTYQECSSRCVRQSRRSYY